MKDCEQKKMDGMFGIEMEKNENPCQDFLPPPSREHEGGFCLGGNFRFFRFFRLTEVRRKDSVDCFVVVE